MHISQSKFHNLQVNLQKASEELQHANTAKGVSQATAKIQNIQNEVNAVIKSFNDRLPKPISQQVSRLQIQKMIVANEGLMKTAYSIRNKAAEILSLKNQAVAYERVGGLGVLHQQVISPQAKQAVTQFQNASRGQPAEIKEAIFSILQKLDQGKLRGCQVVQERVNGKNVEFLVYKGANGVEILPRLGKAQGNDSAIYVKGDKIVKVPSHAAGAKEALMTEFKLYQTMGNQHAKLVTFDDGSVGLEMTRFKGSFDEQVILHQFAKLCGFSSEKLRNLTLSEKEQMIAEKYKEIGTHPDRAMKNAINELAARYNKKPEELWEGLRKEYIPFNKHQRQAMCDQMISGYQELSARGIVHGDIKAQNILWKEDEASGSMVYRFSDFGRSIVTEEKRAIYERLSSFCLPGNASKSLVNVAYVFGKASPELPERSLDEALALFVEAGLMIKLPNGRLEPDVKAIGVLGSLPANFTQLSPEEQRSIREYRDNVRSALSEKGILTPDGKQPAFRLSEVHMNTLISMASIASNPIEGEATTAYLDQNALDWAAFFAKAGRPANMLAAVDAVQQFALGASLYEMVTGFNIPREGSTTLPIQERKLKSIRNRLTELGIKKETVGKITEMLKPLPPSPDNVLAYVQSKMMEKLSGDEERKAMAEARAIVNDLYRTYPELSDAYVDLVRTWGKPDLDPNNLVFSPKKKV